MSQESLQNIPTSQCFTTSIILKLPPPSKHFKIVFFRENNKKICRYLIYVIRKLTNHFLISDGDTNTILVLDYLNGENIFSENNRISKDSVLISSNYLSSFNTENIFSTKSSFLQKGAMVFKTKKGKNVFTDNFLIIEKASTFNFADKKKDVNDINSSKIEIADFSFSFTNSLKFSDIGLKKTKIFSLTPQIDINSINSVNDINDINSTNIINDINNINSVNDINNTNIINDINSTNIINDINNTNNTNIINDITSINDINDINTISKIEYKEDFCENNKFDSNSKIFSSTNLFSVNSSIFLSNEILEPGKRYIVYGKLMPGRLLAFKIFDIDFKSLCYELY